MAAAKENAPAKYTVVEVKHLTVADGIDLPAEYLNGTYDKLREELAKKGIFGTVAEEGGAISDPGAVVLECKIVKFHSNGMTGGHVQVEVTLLSRGDRKLIQQFITQEMQTNGGNWGNKSRVTGHYLAEEIKRNLR
jgi:hypothetical protein